MQTEIPEDVLKAGQDHSRILYQVASIICEETCGLTSQCKSREAAKALFDKGYLAASPIPSVAGWQPIETAPKDGSHIILARFGDEYFEISGGEWNLHPKEGEDGLNGFEAWLSHPTHWMPLPSPPKQEGAR